MQDTIKKATRVAIVEDHDHLRDGLLHILTYSDGFECVDTYASVEEILRRPPDTDVILLDIGLPGKSGIEGLPSIKKCCPNAQIIMLTVFEDEKNIFEAIKAGANGYMLKKTPPAELLRGIVEAVTGGMPMTPLVARQAIEMFRRGGPSVKEDAGLTPREMEILKLLVDGYNYALVAEKLFISLDTVRNHFRHIYEKLHVHSKSEAVAKALKERIV